jgi:hypothetical protein
MVEFSGGNLCSAIKIYTQYGDVKISSRYSLYRLYLVSEQLGDIRMYFLINVSHSEIRQKNKIIPFTREIRLVYGDVADQAFVAPAALYSLHNSHDQ